MRILCCLLLLSGALLGAPSVASAQERAADLIAEANASLAAGDLQKAEIAVRTIIGTVASSNAERAEAYRILALLKFSEGAIAETRAAFLEYLRLDPDAHLDPAMVAPEAITLFEDVRSRNLAELNALKPKRKKKRYVVLNLLPAAGQVQNGQKTKAVLLASGMGLLLGTNIGSYYLLKSYCDEVDRTCSSGDTDRTSSARTLQSVNLLSGVGLISLYAYSVIDGYLGYRDLQKRDQRRTDYMSLQIDAAPGRASASLSLRF